MINDNNVVQDVPIVTDKELEPLLKIQFSSNRGKYPNTHTTTQNLYTANDAEFMLWLARITKTKKEKILEGTLGEEGWNNVNRLKLRIRLMKRFRKSIASYLKTVDKQ